MGGVGRRAGWGAVGVLLLWIPASARASAAVADFVGRRLTDVQVTSVSVPLLDAAVLGLVETTVGESLSMDDVRQTIDHLVALGRFADIQVFAAEDGPSGVRLRYAVVPVDRMANLRLTGTAGVPERAVRDAIQERLGSLPPATRRNEIAETVVALYRSRGYRAASAEVVLQPTGRQGQLDAVVSITAGPQTLVGAVTVDGDDRRPQDVDVRLGLARGRVFDPVALDERVRALQDTLRDEGDYEALVTVSTTEPAPGVADIAVRIDMGDRVRLEFTGDQISASDRRSLVPIERLRSVEEEVIEDGSRNIEQHLRLAGYRQASVRAGRVRQRGTLVVRFDVARGPLHVVDRVDVAGTNALPRNALDPLLKLRAGEPFVDVSASAVAAAVAELYRVRGFADVRVALVVEPGLPAADGRVPVTVRLAVTEGPSTSVGAVRLEGTGAEAVQDVVSTLGLVAGRPYYRPQHVLDRDTIERRLRNLGYQRATVEARTADPRDGNVVDLVYAIDAGARTLVDHVLVSGAVRTSPDLVRRELALRPGAPLGYDAIVESQRRLSVLGLFRRVRISEVPHGVTEDRRDVLVEVEETEPTAITYGGGLEIVPRARRGADGGARDQFDIAPRGFIEVSRRNLWGKNRSLSLLTSVSLRPTDPGADAGPDARSGYGLNQYRVVGTFREPRVFDTAGDAQLSAFMERGVRASFNFDRRGVRGEYARRFANRTTILGRYAYDFTQLFDIKIGAANQLLIDRLFPQVRLSTLFASVLRDSRDDVLDPERGIVVGSDVEVAVPALGSEVGFTKGFAQTFAYRRLPGGRPFVLAAGARLGLARGFDTRVPRLDASGQPVLDATGTPIVDVVNDLPASERFFAGGNTTVRGFALDRLGSASTLNVDGFPTGGNAMLVVNAELRTPYVRGVGLVGFADAGNVFRRAGDLSIGGLRGSAGVGVRYRSPLGPLRFDVGFKLDRLGRGEQRAVYHLSLGQAF